eukprot:145200_1
MSEHYLNVILSMNSYLSDQPQNKAANIALWECKHCGLNNYHVETHCKACFYHQPQNRIISHTKPTQIAQKQNEYEYYQYKSPLDMIPKRRLIVYGYIRKHKPFYPKKK